VSLDLDALERLLSQAFALPVEQFDGDSCVVVDSQDFGQAMATPLHARTIVAAVNALPELIAEVRRLEERNAKLEAVAEAAVPCCRPAEYTYNERRLLLDALRAAGVMVE
jgi:hypothetical protein